ncbi:MAG: peptide-binding protein [Candidatus Goldiibacteriota bacterium HGW-Goldbacteria-1]|nr:MAG: peptide-binding protein [Candidatus Goldiibacteriota bacterium HGW-Goldbacteria-1]
MIKIVLGVLTAVILISGCSKKESYTLKGTYTDAPAYGDMLIDTSTGEPAILNPVLASDSASAAINDLVFNGLVKFDKSLNLVGDLADKWKIKDGGLTIIFHLKNNVKWHDGVSFTAKDVKFTYDAYMAPDTKTSYRSLFEPVKSVRIIDDFTLEVLYKKPFAPALQYWGTGILPAHLFAGIDINTASFNRTPVGTGPYIFKNWKTGRSLELISNKTHFDGSPYITNYMLRIIPDQSVQFMNLQSGDADMMELSSDLYFTKANTEYFNKNFNKFVVPAFLYTYIGYNQENPIFASVKTRQALSYAINTAEIIKNVRRGMARPISGPFIPGSYAYDESVKPYEYNPEKAAQLLKEDGWVKGDDGFLTRQGIPFEFTLATNQGNKEREEIAAIAQQEFSKLGIKVHVRVLAWNIFITDFINKKKFDAVVMGWSLTRDPDCYDIWHSSKTNEGEFNFVGYKNRQVDRLLEDGRSTYDTEKRKVIYRKIHSLIAKDAPYTFIYSPYTLPVIHKRIHGIKPEAAGIGYNFTKWYVPSELQKYRIALEK